MAAAKAFMKVFPISAASTNTLETYRKHGRTATPLHKKLATLDMKPIPKDPRTPEFPNEATSGYKLYEHAQLLYQQIYH